MMTRRSSNLHHHHHHPCCALIRLGCATAVLFGLAAPAHADIATLTYETTLFEVPNAGWPAGVTLSGTLVYDTEAIAEQLNTNQARYHGISHSVRLSKDNASATFISNDDPIIGVNNDLFANFTVYVDDFRAGPSETNGAFLGFEIYAFAVIFHAESTTPLNILTSTALPLEQATLESFPESSRVGAIYFKDMEGTAYANAPVLRTFSLVLEEEYVLACDGFYEPFDRAISLSKGTRRVIPLRMSLLDPDDTEIGPDVITAPVVSVTHTAIIGGGELDELVDATGRATEGNLFVWDDAAGEWTFNLSTKPFTSEGTYTVGVTAGNDDYAIDPTCTGTFVRQ